MNAPRIASRGTPHAGRVVALTALLVGGAISVLGWTTGLRQVLHGLLLAGGLAAFLPFVILACVAGLVLMLGILLAIGAAVSGEVGLEGAATQGTVALAERGRGVIASSVAGYYRFLGRRRHPLWTGLAAGTVLGVFFCWGLLALFIVPAETQTTELLLQAQLQIEAQRKASGHYPSPDLEGRLVIDAQPLTDAFGRPFQYSLSGRWKTQSYRLSSLGADGTASSDDLCVANRSRLAVLAERVVEPLAALELLRGSAATWTSKLQALRAARCAD